ncbi:hypothetical protein [Natronobacterium gregoryi]|uniref:Uncharacterized protein n=2 Tax=Natronobacterium gregoryi TaxID=44930 RepID=L0AP54_NATGS|nr:hypothetical protein [Natronobacterium gregoryi]AFZ74885.1 hypothetical protein Natgr_3784 [Natronobacterium gregoryi SP2]ELY73303.1 hypothetical protein C490_01812 [Natronobacterium gregoryi SP2]PLK19304.1 hypothetical protein CYV19_15605 [Natronobacterium gregoryi SP2]SFJ53068.1 hypothetical protein SAMN05443661_1375 [Natronobacterium gregoryi]
MALHFRRATTVFRQTLPFVLLRIGVGLALGLFTIIYFGVVVWIGTRLLTTGTISGWIAGIGALVAIGLFVWGWRLASTYVLYLVKAGHIAVIAHAVETGEVPDEQLRYGKAQVTDHFAEASALFALDKLVKAAIEQFNDSVVSVADRLGAVPTLEKLVRVAGKAVAVAASYVDEAIIAYLFTERAGDDPWQSAKDGVVLYGKSWKSVLGSTMLIVVGLYATAVGLFLVLSPIAGVLAGLSPTFEVAGWVVVAGLTLTVYEGLLKPWVKTVVITTFLLESRDRTPDEAMADRLASRSETFRELSQQADDRTASDADSRRQPITETSPP